MRKSPPEIYGNREADGCKRQDVGAGEYALNAVASPPFHKAGTDEKWIPVGACKTKDTCSTLSTEVTD